MHYLQAIAKLDSARSDPMLSSSTGGSLIGEESRSGRKFASGA
jgi:hypothetical protein